MAEKKKVRIVLYKMHDYDLVRMYVSLKDKTLGNTVIPFAKLMKGLLAGCVRGTSSKIPRINAFTDEDLPSKIYVRFTLDPDKDRDLIDFVESIRDRQINSFFKSLIRRSLPVSELNCYLDKPLIKEDRDRIKKEKEEEIAKQAYAKLSSAPKKKPAPAPAKPAVTIEPEQEKNSSFNLFDSLP